MVVFDEDALICDFAETYHIYDYRSLPVDLVATLAVGLRENSRIKIKMSGLKMEFNQYLLAALFDKVNWLCWAKTKDAENGVNVPDRILNRLLGIDQEEAGDEYAVFDTPESFEAARQAILGEV